MQQDHILMHGIDRSWSTGESLHLKTVPRSTRRKASRMQSSFQWCSFLAIPVFTLLRAVELQTRFISVLPYCRPETSQPANKSRMSDVEKPSLFRLPSSVAKKQEDTLACFGKSFSNIAFHHFPSNLGRFPCPQGL